MAKPTEFESKLGRAIELQRLISRIEADRAAWRLSPRAFLEFAMKAAGLANEGDLHRLGDRLEEPDATEALRAVRSLMVKFTPTNEHAPAAPGWRGRLTDTEIGILGACGLTPSRAVALASWWAISGHTPVTWNGKAEFDGQAAKILTEAVDERDELAAWLDTNWRQAPYQISAPNSDGMARITIMGVPLVPGDYAMRLIMHMAAQPEAMRKAA